MTYKRLIVMPRIRYILRLLIGLVFIASAVAKLVSIDSFEIYLFSLELLPLGISFIAARLLICLETILGIWFITGINYKTVNILTMLMLCIFSGFLLGLYIDGNSDNCHCFGEFVNLTPFQSILKNAILILAVFFSFGEQWFMLKRQKLITLISIIAVIAAVFIVSPPDNFRYDSYKSSDMVNEIFLDEAINNGDISEDILKGEKIVCFFSVRCEFCAMSAQKLGILRRLGDFSRAEVFSYFGKGDETTIDDAEAFIDKAKLDCNNIYFIKPATFLRITNGDYPLILLLRDGKIIESYSYRDLH